MKANKHIGRIMKIYPYPSKEAEQKVKNTIDRGLGFTQKDQEAVEGYLDDVKTRGDQALVEYTNRFDSQHVTIESLKVTQDEFDHAVTLVDSSFLKTLDRSISQLEYYHNKQKENSWIDTPRNGVMVGQQINTCVLSNL